MLVEKLEVIYCEIDHSLFYLVLVKDVVTYYMKKENNAAFTVNIRAVTFILYPPYYKKYDHSHYSN